MQTREIIQLLTNDTDLLIRVMELMLIRPKLFGTYIAFHCPIHTYNRTDNPPFTARYYLNTNSYNCYTCNERGYYNAGNIIALTKCIYTINSTQDARVRIEKHIDYIKNERELKAQQEIIKNPTKNIQIIDAIDAPPPIKYEDMLNTPIDIRDIRLAYLESKGDYLVNREFSELLWLNYYKTHVCVNGNWIHIDEVIPVT